MTTVPSRPVVSVDEYLNSSYRPDLEFVDGVLVERGVATVSESVLKMLLIEFFGPYQKALRFLALPDVRTQIAERGRYRIPDVMLCPLPLPKSKVVTTVPWAVIEILSPEDRMAETLERFKDYASIGVKELVLVDPGRYVAYQYSDGSLIRTEFEKIPLPGGQSVPFPSQELFERLRATLESQEPSPDA